MVSRSSEGTEVFEELKSALARAHQTLGDCQQEAERLDARMRELLAQRGEALLKLARHYLPEISRASIESTFEGIRSDLLAIFARREAERKELQAQLDQRNQEVRRRNAEIDEVTRKLNEKVALREKLEAQVTEALKGNAEFQDRSKLALQAEENLHHDERRAEDMARESAEKLPHYEQSRLFRYLHDRGFGTSEYKAARWVRSIDRWVADLIDYPNARNGYEFLKKTPELVVAEVARRREQFEGLTQQVEAIRKLEADKQGLTAVLEEGGALGTERDRLVQELEQVQKEAQGFQQGLSDLEQAQNQFYTQAIERFRAFLGDTKLAVLQKRAKQTPEPEDDAIVAELARLDGEIDATDPQLANLTERRKDANRVQDALDRMIRLYRQANYDSDRSYFKDFDVRREINRVEDGNRDADDLWRSFQAAQAFRPNWAESTASRGIEAASSPAGRVVLGAIVDIVGAALQVAATKAVHRHVNSVGPTQKPSAWPSNPNPEPSAWPSSSDSGGVKFEAPAAPASEPSRSSSDDSFTTGEGF